MSTSAIRSHDDTQPDLIDHIDKTIGGLLKRREEEEGRQAKLAVERAKLDAQEAADANALLLVDCLAALRLVSASIPVSEQVRIKGVKGRIVAELEKRRSA